MMRSVAMTEPNWKEIYELYKVSSERMSMEEPKCEHDCGDHYENQPSGLERTVTIPNGFKECPFCAKTCVVCGKIGIADSLIGHTCKPLKPSQRIMDAIRSSNVDTELLGKALGVICNILDEHDASINSLLLRREGVRE